METVVIAVHIIVALAIIGLILLQQGKGAEMGASFGSGSSQTLFGPQGAGTVFSRATAILVAIFFITSFTLALLAQDGITGSTDEGIPNVDLIEQAPVAADTEIPQAPVQMQKQESDIPE